MKISVVTISYNQASYLDEAIQSIISQGDNLYEYIIVDPGSTDGSRDIINNYSTDISKIIFEPDEGPSDGLNKGFSYATGDIFGYINADDRLISGALKFVDDFFSNNPEIDVLSGGVRIIDQKGNPSFRHRTSDKFNLTNYASGISTICQQATFFRRSAFEKAHGFNNKNKVSWDGELLVDMAIAGCTFTTIKKLLGDFRIYESSITGSGSYNVEIKKTHQDICLKIKNSGIRLHPPLLKHLHKLFYKINMKRHYDYLTVKK